MTLQLYLLRRLLVALGIALGCLGLALFPPTVLSALSRLGGVGMGLVLSYLPFLAVELFPYLLPMAFLLAVVGTFSRMAANGEWVAIQMSRVHPLRTALPGLALGALLTGASFYVVNEVFPALRLKQDDYKQVAALRLIRGLFPGRTTIQAGEFSVVSWRRVGLHRFENVVVRLPAVGDEPTRRVVADAVDLTVVDDVMRISFDNARITSGASSSMNKNPVVEFPLSDLSIVKRANPRRARYMLSSAIRTAITDGSVKVDDQRAYRFEVEQRNALAFSYLVFLLLGIPTGLRLATESMLGPVSVSLLYACLYYVLALRIGHGLVFAESVPVWIGAWSANAVGLCAALVLSVRWRNLRPRAHAPAAA